jgi:hypothetical protein
MKTVHWRVSDPEHRFVSNFSWAASMYYPMLNKFFETFFRGDFPNKGKQVYEDHVAEVRSLVPPENLLEYKISDGWGPLCEFLGEEVPDTAFPRGNDMADFFKRCRGRNRRQMANAALQAVTMGGAVIAAGFVAASIFKRFSR